MKTTTNLNKYAIATGSTPLTDKIRMTKWTAPHPVTKQLELTDDGSIRKVSTANQLYEGSVERIECKPADFIKILDQIGNHDCLSYGLPLDDQAHSLMTTTTFVARGSPPGAMARKANKMVWPPGPAIFMGDYDPEGDASLSPEKLRETLYGLCPAMRDAAHIWAASTSSCLYKGRKEVRGIKGQRLYFVVSDGTDIPRAAKVLERLAWLAGHGYIKISKAGALLARWLLDGAVFQTNRIDYCAPAICVPPLFQKKPKPTLHGNAKLALDTRNALPDLIAADEATYQQLLSNAKAGKGAEAAIVRTAHQLQRAKELVAQGVDPGAAQKMIEQATEHNVLLSDFRLIAEDGTVVSVGELLADKGRWHGRQFADPIEPDYHDDNRIATAYLVGTGRPYVHSYAHGGCRYYLAHAAVTVRLDGGQRHPCMEEIVATFLRNESFYRRGNALATIDADTKIVEVNPYQTLAEMDRQFRFEKQYNKEVRPVDPPVELARLFGAAYAHRFPRLKAIITAPIIVPLTGRLISQPGYDAETSVFAAMPDDLPRISATPVAAEIQNALQTVWFPVHRFPFATAVDQTVMLTAILTAVMRPLLPTAPGFAFDAPIQSSGKTLLTKFLATLMGVTPAMAPHAETRNDEETRKRLFSMLLGGSGVIVFDNIVGEFDSPSLASMLTAEQYTDRVLSVSRTETVPTNSLVLLSGNNLILKGDLTRRLLRCRIDPQTESPHTRSFEFDPVEIVREFRQELVAAALTLIMAYLSNKTVTRVAPGRTGSFEVWDDIVRQTVCWLTNQQKQGSLPAGEESEGKLFPCLGDPLAAINAAVEEDPMRSMHGRLIQAIASEMSTGNTRAAAFTVKTLIEKSASQYGQPAANGSATGEGGPRLRDVLIEVAGNPVTNNINSNVLGRALTKYKDRVCGGLRLRKGEPYQGSSTYYVENVLGDSGDFGESKSAVTNKKENNVIPIGQKKPTKPTNATGAVAPPDTQSADEKRLKGVRGG